VEADDEPNPSSRRCNRRRFGRRGDRFVEGYPEIYIVSNVIEKGALIGSLGAGELVSHTDISYQEDPPKASMLYALEMPPIWAYATRDELTWYNDWRVGDLVLWHSRCTMHRRDPFDPDARRVMPRTQIKGETRPVA
jgi:alpha-ketoglutarate-dependent taurine dioxygenase